MVPGRGWGSEGEPGVTLTSASSGVPSAARLAVNTNCSLTFADSQHDDFTTGCRLL